MAYVHVGSQDYEDQVQCDLFVRRVTHLQVSVRRHWRIFPRGVEHITPARASPSTGVSSSRAEQRVGVVQRQTRHRPRVHGVSEETLRPVPHLRV